MSFTNDLLAGIATALDGAGVAKYRSDNTAYLPGESAVRFRLMPVLPNRCVAINAYLAHDEVLQSRSRIGVQLMFRGNPDDGADVDDFADNAFQVLQTLTGVQMGSTWLIQLLRTSYAWHGQDDEKRYLRGDNYYADINVPTTAHRPE